MQDHCSPNLHKRLNFAIESPKFTPANLVNYDVERKTALRLALLDDNDGLSSIEAAGNAAANAYHMLTRSMEFTPSNSKAIVSTQQTPTLDKGETSFINTSAPNEEAKAAVCESEKEDSEHHYKRDAAV